jgi:hypothetical protein
MRLGLALALVVFGVGPALAMNWEGHDDWMADHPAALAYEREASPAPPVGRRTSPCISEDEVGQAVVNAYEQVPLRRHICPATTKPHEPRR